MTKPWPVPKILFHLGLATILLFGVGLFVLWAFALFALFAYRGDPELKRWTRRLVALAALDSVLVASFGALMVPQLLTAEGQVAVPGSERVLGISLSEVREPGVRVATVHPEGPADTAGVREGDLLVEIAGEPVDSVAAAQQQVATAAGEVELRLLREGQTLSVRATPVLRTALKPASQRGLFVPQGSGPCLPYQTQSKVPWALLISAASLTVLYLVGRQRGMDATLLWCGALLLTASLVTQAAAIATCLQVGGPSGGGVIVSLYVQTAILLAGGLWLTRRTQRSQPPEIQRPWIPTALLGALYMLTGAVRVGVTVLVLQQLLGRSVAPYSESVLHQVASSGLSWQAAVAFVIPVTLLGPLSEELLFRGAVLPWLARWLRPFLAIAISGVLFGALHLFYGPFVLIVMYYGVVLGWARLHSGGLKAPVALHIAINATASAVLLLTRAMSG